MSDERPPDHQTAPTDPAALPSGEWFYEKSGTQFGPVTAEAIRALLDRGDISHDTLAWNSTFGQQWKAIRETNIAQSNMPPPLPASHVNNSFAWLLALIPIIGAFGEKVTVNGWGVVASQTQLFLIYVAINSVFALSDASYLQKSGRNPKNIRLGIWFWLVPAYLFQRARALGQPFVHFWVWVISFVAGVFVSNPDILSGSTYWGTGLPACNSSFAANQVKSVFKNIPLMRLAEIQAIDVGDQSEVSVTDTMRTCQATVIASNAANYTVSYTIELRGEQIFTKLNIVQ